jgi:hypothetical protein
VDADSALTNAPEADGEVMWSRRLEVGVKLADASPPMTVSRKPDHRGEHEVVSKPLRAGTLGESGWTCGDDARVLCFISHARLRVQWHPAFPTPSSGETIKAKLGRIAPRECGLTSFFCFILRDGASRFLRMRSVKPHGEKHGNAVRLEPSATGRDATERNEF